MNAATITYAHFKDQMLQHLRAPGYLIPTLAMPALFFFLFEGESESTVDATFIMASYTMWAILAVAFFQFGVGIASARSTPWESFLRTLPLPPLLRMAGRLLAATVFRRHSWSNRRSSRSPDDPRQFGGRQAAPLGSGPPRRRGHYGVRWDRHRLLVQSQSRPARRCAGMAVARLLRRAVGRPQSTPQLDRAHLPIYAHPAVGRAQLARRARRNRVRHRLARASRLRRTLRGPGRMGIPA